MRAINHAVTGAVIGLTVTAPVAAIPLAFLSHYALDALPHYDDREKYPIGSDGFFVILIIDSMLCLALVALLFALNPNNWLLPSLCAFMATSPDLMWVPKFLYARKTKSNEEPDHKNPFLRFHSKIQKNTGPKGISIELIWLLAGIYIIFLISN